MPKPSRCAPWLLALTLGLAACTPAAERAERARAAAGEAIGRGDRSAALAAVDEVRKNLPDDADSLLQVTALLTRAGEAPRADWLLEEGVRKFPDRDDVRLALVQISLQLGNPTRAREVALAIRPDSAQHAAAMLLRAQAELDLGNLDQALATLVDAEKRYPDRPEARLARIGTLLQEQRNDEARAAIEQAHAALAGDDEKNTELRRRLDLTLAQLEAQQGDAETALASLRAMVQADPKDVLAWRALVQVLAKEQRAEEAIPLLSTALANESAPLELGAVVPAVVA